jgi:hypothetical protein
MVIEKMYINKAFGASHKSANTQTCSFSNTKKKGKKRKAACIDQVGTRFSHALLLRTSSDFGEARVQW